VERGLQTAGLVGECRRKIPSSLAGAEKEQFKGPNGSKCNSAIKLQSIGQTNKMKRANEAYVGPDNKKDRVFYHMFRKFVGCTLF
jgi:hypothetical protein